MSWARLDENAIDHPKFLALTDGAWRLWCEGQCYCRKHLTNGRINAAALKHFRYYSPSRVTNLTTIHVEGKGPCWERLENGDIQVHDYLDWNDSAAEIQKAKSDARERKRRFADRNAERRRVENAVPDALPTANVSSWAGFSSSGSEVMERGVGKTTDERAGEFVQWYEDTHQRLFGFGYIGTQKDWPAALELCKKLSDQQVRDAALVWFGQDDDFALNGTRSIPKFASRASGCLQLARRAGIA